MAAMVNKVSLYLSKNPQMKAVLIFLHFPAFSWVGWLSYTEPIFLQDNKPKIEL